MIQKGEGPRRAGPDVHDRGPDSGQPSGEPAGDTPSRQTSLAATNWTVILAWAALIALFGAAFWLRSYRLGDPIGGFHAMNEGFYSRISVADAQRGAFAWLVSPIDLNNPPAYSLLVTTAFRLLAPGEAIARWVSVLSGLIAVGLTGLLGAELWDRRVGVFSALVLALMPGAVLVSRNAQVDPLSVAFSLAALVAWLYSARDNGIRWAVASGVFLGLGVLTKLPAVLVIPAMITWDVVRSGGVRWVKSKRVAAALVSAAVVALPWYVTRMALGAAEFMSWQTGTVSRTGVFLRGSLVRSMLVEPYWMLSIFAVVCVAVGLVVMVRRREAGDYAVGAYLIGALAFLVFFHFHTYYWLPAMPALALVAGRGLGAFADSRSKQLTTAVVTVVFVGMALSSALMLSGNKWGQWSPVTLQPLAAQSPGKTSVIVAAGLWDNSLGPAMELYLPEGAARREGAEVKAWGDKVIFIGPADGRDPQARQMVQTRVRPVLFGRALWQDPPNVNFFENGRWVAEKVGPLWQFGLATDDYGARFAFTDITGESR